MVITLRMMNARLRINLNLICLTRFKVCTCTEVRDEAKSGFFDHRHHKVIKKKKSSVLCYNGQKVKKEENVCWEVIYFIKHSFISLMDILDHTTSYNQTLLMRLGNWKDFGAQEENQV